MTATITKLRLRLEYLINTVAAEIAKTQQLGQFGSYLDEGQYVQWRTSALTTIKSLAPETHFEHDFRAFDDKHLDSPSTFNGQLAVLKALLDDLDGGHLANVK